MYVDNITSDAMVLNYNGKAIQIKVYEDLLKEKDKEIERLNKKIEQYENPEDMTLMFMWCDEKAKDEIKRLNNIINKIEKMFNHEILIKYYYGMSYEFEINDFKDDILKIIKGSE